MRFRVLAVSGSLRAVSTNTGLLQAAQVLADSLFDVALYEGLADLPHFNPDHDGDVLPSTVAGWRRAVGEADALLISTPEYARGIPGSLKNALDWLVGDPHFAGKPVAIFSASPRAVEAHKALTLTLKTMSVDLLEAAAVTVPLLGRPATVEHILADGALTAEIRTGLALLHQALEERRAV
ncbi:MAG: NADPH-dependent FMN reductase [Acetobacteraceae bacterium]